MILGCGRISRALCRVDECDGRGRRSDGQRRRAGNGTRGGSNGCAAGCQRSRQAGGVDGGDRGVRGTLGHRAGQILGAVVVVRSRGGELL